jgi:hypothetical protein
MTTLPPAPEEPQAILSGPADYQDTFKFLNFIFAGMTGDFVEFRYFAASRRFTASGPSTYHALPLNREQVVEDVLRRNGQQTITFGPAPRCRIPRKDGGGKDHDVLQVSCVWAALEPKKVKGGVIEAMKKVRDLPLRPSIVVSARSAYHIFFVLNSALRDHQLLEWDELMRGLNAVLGCTRPDSISRTIILPGTHNVDGVPSVECEISEEFSSWTRYGTGELGEAIESAPAHGHPRHTVFSAGQLRQRGLSAELIESIISGRAMNLVAPVTRGLGNETGRDFQIAFVLLEHGLDEAEIKAIFRSYPHGCGSKWAQKKDGERYLDSILNKVITARQELMNAGSDEDGFRESILGITGLPPSYSQHEDGSLWFHPPVVDEARKVPKPVKVCNSPLRITEIRENVDTKQISAVITFSYLGRNVSAPILRSQMSDPRQLAATLSDVGAPVTSLNARHVTAYLSAFEHHFAESIRRKQVTSRFGRGREGRTFFFPGLSAGVEFVPTGAGEAALYRAYASHRGTLQGWLEAVRAITDEGLLIPQVAVLAALVPPLQRKLQIPNFILDLHGNTSTGKSTSLRLAASIYGSPRDPDSLLLQWMNTSTAVEHVASVCGELPVFLDDAQHCPADLKRSVIYMIANGRGKGRGGGRGGVRETPTWHTVALSSSEEPLQEASPHEGARGRILPVGGLVPPFKPRTGVLVQAVERMVSDNHGHVGVAYIRHLNGWTEQEWSRWRRRYSEIRDELQRASSSNLTGRVSGYIAAVQLAGEVACPLLGLPFQSDVVGAWLMLHLDEQQREQNMVLIALRALADHYIANMNHFAGDGGYTPGGRSAIQGVVKKGLFVGYLRDTIDSIFKARKWKVTAVLNKLTAVDVLLATEKERHTKKVSLEGVQHRLVCVRWAALFTDDMETPH